MSQPPDAEALVRASVEAYNRHDLDGCLALLTPAATLVLMAGTGPLAARFVGTLGRLAARTVTTSIARTGVAIAALMVAVSVTIGVSLMIQSFRSTVGGV